MDQNRGRSRMKALSAFDAELLDRLNEMSPERLLSWSWENYEARAAIFTSFQNTGCVLVDMSRRVASALRVITVDTLRLHRETYELIAAMEERYGVSVERFQPNPDRVKRMVEQHGEYLFFDNVEKQEYCCQVRKVEPNERALETVDVWITGLRRDHGKPREGTPRIQIVEHNGRPIMKLCPLADWTEERVWRYIRDNDVPHSGLYLKGYSSIGCEVCTTPTLPGESKRAGRWRWTNQLDPDHHKECGIHKNGSGI
jgi:phosphoadenosine phosphosulfate reductase